MGGSILGILIGEKILPLVIINGYGIMYKGMMNNIQIRYEFKFAMIAAGAATVCTVGATIFSCYRALAETPASLMRPPAPKDPAFLEAFEFYMEIYAEKPFPI